MATLKILKDLDINVKNENNEFRTMSEILEEISSRWSELCEKEQNNISSEITNSKRVQTKTAIFSYEIQDRMLLVNVEKGKIDPRYLFKILINEGKIDIDYRYKRVSPYKINLEEIEDSKQNYIITFKDISNHEKVDQSTIITTNSKRCLERGDYKIFIPDFIEVLKYMNTNHNSIIVYDGETYHLSDFANYMKPKNYLYIRDKQEVKNEKLSELTAQGFEIPVGYLEYLDRIIK